MVERNESYLACDLALRVGEILLSSGAGAADVTATMLAVTRASGIRGVTSDVTYTDLSLRHQPSLDAPEVRQRAVDSGVSAFLTKAIPMTEVMDEARRVMGIVPRTHAGGWRPTSGAPTQSKPRLSAGETQALTLYVSGLSTQEVAEEMDVQYETAKTYLRRVREKYAKAGRPASRKAELIRRAAEDGYLK